MDIDAEFSELLGTLYEGALEEQPWQSFLASVRELLGAHLVTLVLRPPSEQEDTVMLADGGSLSAIKSYNEGQFVLDPFINLPSGQVVALHEHMSTETLLASDFYQIIMEPQGWYDFLGADIREGDELFAVRLTDGNREILMGSSSGLAIRFKEQDVRAMGRTAAGVTGMRFKSADDRIVGLAVLGENETILTITERGFGKRTPIEDYRLQTRGGKGVINIKTTAKNGPVIAVLSVAETDEIMVISEQGMIMRIAVAGISVIGRATQGVRIMDLDDADRLVAVAKVVETVDPEDRGDGDDPEDRGDDPEDGADDSGTDTAGNASADDSGTDTAENGSGDDAPETDVDGDNED